MGIQVIYAYKCRSCGTTTDSTTRADVLCGCTCGGLYTRFYVIRTTPVMPEHFNPTVGKPISSHHQFAEELKRTSEEYTLRTGRETRFVPTDPTDPHAVGVTGEGLDSTNRARVARGLPAIDV